MAVGQRPVKLTPRQEKESYAAVTMRDGFLCVRCGKLGRVDRDHRQNRDAYNTVPSNLQCLGSAFGCGCHKWKTENPSAAFSEGFAVPRYARPELWPAWRFDVGWVLYFDEADADGNWWQEISQTTADLLMNGGAE